MISWRQLVLCLIGAWCLFLPSRAVPASSPAPTVENGVLDLRNHSFAEQSVVALNGQWRFFWQQWRSPEQLAAMDSRAPGASFIRVPSNWNQYEIAGQAVGGRGFATYDVTILLPPDIRLCSIYVKGISSAFTLYANAQKILTVGSPARDAGEAVPKFTSEVVDVVPEKGRLHLVFHVSNWHHFKGGIWYGIDFGPIKVVNEARVSRVALSFFFLGAVLLMGLYHLRLYFVRQNNKEYLFFALFCLMMSLRIFVLEERLVMCLFPGLPWQLLLRLEYLSFYLGGSAVLAYIYHLFPLEFPVRLHTGLQTVVLIYSGTVVLLPSYYFTRLLKSFQIFAFACVVICVGVLIRAFLKERYGIKTFFVGLLFFSAAVVNDLLFAMGVIRTAYLFHVGSFIFMLSQAVILIRKYARAFQTIEIQEADLNRKNEQLVQELQHRETIEKARRESEALFRAAVKHAPVPMLVCSGDDETVLIMNNKFTEVFGYHARDIPTLEMWRTLVCPDAECRRRVELLWTGDGISGDRVVEVTVACKDGAQKEVSVQASSLADTVIIAIVDLSEHKAAERKRKDLEGRLQHAQKMESIGTIAGGVAHDFNNILSIILGNAELAIDQLGEKAPSLEHVQEIKKASLRAAGIVKHLLNFARKADVTLKPLDIVPVIRDSFRLIRSTIPSSIEMTRKLPDQGVTILADPIQINQVLINICTNASQAMEETGGRLDLDVEQVYMDRFNSLTATRFVPGWYLKIAIRDTGQGIDPEIVNRIFDPYFTTKEVGKGSGLGLSVVMGIVKSHRGAIDVNCKSDKGCEFVILFPVIDEESIEPEGNLQIPGTGTEHILFVDDEPYIAGVSKKGLEQLGFTVVARTDPTEALAAFEQHPDDFDIVVTDMAMPKMTGARLSQKIKAIRPDMPVIICTGYSALLDEEKAKQLGISAFVMKPVEIRRLVETIRSVLDAHDSGQQ